MRIRFKVLTFKKKNMKQFLSCDTFSPFYIYLNIFIKFTIHKRYRVHTLYIDTEHLISSFIYYKAIGMLVEALNIFNLCNKNFLRTHTHTHAHSQNLSEILTKINETVRYFRNKKSTQSASLPTDCLFSYRKVYIIYFHYTKS